MTWKQGNTTERGYGHHWRKQRDLILSRDMYLCQECLKHGRTSPAIDVDHIIQKADGGTDDPSNLQSLCKPCHKAKTLRDQGKEPKPQIGLDGYPV